MEILLAYAMSKLNMPYKWGGDDPIDGYDCSGLVQDLLASVGLDPPGDQTAQSLFDHFSKANARWNVHGCGSLAFYGKDASRINHVAMMISNYQIIEAGGGGSGTRTHADAAEQNAFVRVRLLNHRKDLVALLRPDYAAIGQIK